MAGIKFRTCFRALAVFLAVIGLAGLTPRASADTLIFSIPGGTTVGGQPVSATAILTTSTDHVQVVLVNTIENPTSVIQNLSDFKFYLTPSLNTGTLVSSAGLERTVASNGTFTDGSVVDTGWQLETGDGLRVHVLGTPTGPAHTILGLPDSGTNTYSNANNSIAGNGPHNPFLFGAVFEIDVPGVTADSTSGFVIFSFGTTEGNDVPVPEPTSMLLMGGIFAGLGAFGYRRRFIRQQVAS